MAILNTFQRKENKYMISRPQQDALLDLIGDHLVKDEYGESTVSNIYLDTPQHYLIRESIDVTEDKRPYKEKVRIRAYNIPEAQDNVFIELKKKFKGVVYKRRLTTTLAKAERYLKEGVLPEESQIMREIDWTMKKYGMPQPSIMVFYERLGYFDREQPCIRITFDRNTRYRMYDLSYEYGSGGRLLFADDTMIMEIKASGAYPLWLVDALDSLDIRKRSFSKVAAAYRKEFKETPDRARTA